MKPKYHIIPHVHWDREWYFTQEKSTLYLLHNLSEVIESLEKNEEITYYLFDAQTSLIDDYLKYYPHMKDRLCALIKKKRLLTGPWYTQTDQLVVHGESIVRNLMYGMKSAEEYGHCFKVGYAPDCFGQGNQMPQIYQGMDIPYTIFKRGIQFDVIPSTEFIWKSEDGSSVKAYHAVDYMNFRNPSNDFSKNIEYLEKLTDLYMPRSKTGEIYLFNGFDQHPIRKDIINIMKGLNDIDMNHLEDVLENTFQNKELPEYIGELTAGEKNRVHKSIFSSRADMKVLNSKAENKLVRIVEPLQAIYFEHTGRSHKNLIKSCWKLMMENAAHDSIGCCNSDEVNKEITSKFRYVHNMLDEYIDITKRCIHNLIISNPYSIQVYNMLPYSRTETIEIELLTPYKNFCLVDSKNNEYPVTILELNDVTKQVKERAWWHDGTEDSYEVTFKENSIYQAKIQTTVTINSMGYQTFEIKESDLKKPNCKLENEYLKITLNANGTINVYDKKNNFVYDQVLSFEDGADAGDSYDWSSYPYDELLFSNHCKAKNIRLVGNNISCDIELVIPANLEERKNRIYSKTISIHIEYTLIENKSEVDVKVKVNNTATDHRLRVLINTKIPSKYSYADTTFGDIKRPVYLSEERNWKENGWTERPRTIEPMQSYMYLTNENRYVGIVTDSVKEYQIIGKDYDTIAYTLYRSFPMLGRAELPDRPGRASGFEIETPDANLFKEMEFTFGLVFGSTKNQIIDYAQEYTTQLFYYQDEVYAYTGHEFPFCKSVYDHTISMPKDYSSFEIKGDNTKLSIYKLAEDSNHGIIRVVQSENDSLNVYTNKCIKECQMNETNDKEFDSKRIYVKNKIVTLKIK